MIQIDSFLLIEEPQTPGQAERLSPLQKNTLVLQRSLKDAAMQDDQAKVDEILEQLGFVGSNELCSCLPEQVVVQEANQRVEKVLPNFHLVRETLRGKIYECNKCGCLMLRGSAPCKLNERLEAVRSDPALAPVGKGHDIVALVNKEDCGRCPKG